MLTLYYTFLTFIVRLYYIELFVTIESNLVYRLFFLNFRLVFLTNEFVQCSLVVWYGIFLSRFDSEVCQIALPHLFTIY